MSATQYTAEELKLLNAELCEKLASNDDTMFKQGASQVDDFTRFRVREDGVSRRIIPYIPITDADLDRDYRTTKPIKIVDMENDVPAAVTIPFEHTPSILYLRTDRYPVQFARIATEKFVVDVDTLRTCVMDVRQVTSDNAIREILTEEDSRWFTASNRAVGTAGQATLTAGTVQWAQLRGGLSRDNYIESLKYLPMTPSRLEAHVAVMNNLTVKDFMKWGRNEWGGDISADIMKQGWSMEKVAGPIIITTIKHTLVPSGTVFYYGDPKFIGKAYELEATTLHAKRELWFVEFCAAELIGGTLANTNSCVRVDFINNPN